MTNLEKLNELYPHTLRCTNPVDCAECAEYLALALTIGQEMQDAIKKRGGDHPLLKRTDNDSPTSDK